MKENCAECRHHDAFWGGSGCNLLNNGESCKFNPNQNRSKVVRIDPVQPPMTNADRIRSLSDEELVEFIKNIKVRAALCKAVKNNDAFEELCSAEWLKQPAEED